MHFKAFVGTPIIWIVENPIPSPFGQAIMLQPRDLEKVTLTYLLQTPGRRVMCCDELDKAVSE